MLAGTETPEYLYIARRFAQRACMNGGNMLLWLENNWGTLLVAAILILIVGLVLYKMIRDRTAGKTSCGGNCAGCAWAGRCHEAGSKREDPPQIPPQN